MKGKQLRKAVLLGMAMSMAVWTTGMAEDVPQITTSQTVTESAEDITVTNTPETGTADSSHGAIDIRDVENIDVSLTTNGEGNSINVNSTGYGILTSGTSTGTITLNSFGDNAILFEDGSGISADSGVSIELKAAGDNTITYLGDGDHDGINAGANNTGGISLQGANNIINVLGNDSDGIYTDTGSHNNTDLIAESGNNTIIAGNNGIDHRGNGTVKLQAHNGSNIIHAGEGQTGMEGDGIRVAGSGDVTLDAQYNEITGHDEGIYVGSGANATITITATGEKGNYIQGNDNGIEVAGPGVLNITAENGINTIKGNETGSIASNGGKVNIDTKNGELVITGGNIGAEVKKDSDITITTSGDNEITGDSTTSVTNDGGTMSITSQNGSNTLTGGITSVHVTNGGYTKISAYKDNNLIGTGDGVGNAINSVAGTTEVIAQTGNNTIRGGMSAIAINPNAKVTVTALQGTNYLYGDYDGGNGIYAMSDSSVYLTGQRNEIQSRNGLFADGASIMSLQATGTDNSITANLYGMVAQNSATVEMTANGDNHITASGEKGYGIYAVNGGGVNLDAALENSVYGHDDGIIINNSTVTLDAGTDNKVGSDVIGIYTYTGATATLTAGENNVIQSGMVDVEGFGSGRALYATTASTVILAAEQGVNSLSGAVDARNANTAITLNALNNAVYSSAVINNAGGLNKDEDPDPETSFKDKKVISALYAEDGATIVVSGERNEFRSYAADPSDTGTLERTVWAYDGANIEINGSTLISTDRYDETLTAQQGNSADIAIAAGTAVNLTNDQVLANADSTSKVTLNYGAGSSITGDILSAYAGQVDIQAQDGSDAGISVKGNILAGNNGVLNIDLGKGGYLEGRADDYGDAGLNTTGEDNIDQGHATHEFFNPAFSSTIFKGGEVNLSMGEGSRWNVTGQSWVTRINTESAALADDVLAAENPVEAMNHMATIDLVEANTDRNTNAHALTVYEMTGDAVFNMSLDADRDVSDMLYMKSANGDYIINVVDAVTLDDMYAEGFDGLRFATVGEGSNVSFRAVTVGQGVFNVEYEVGTDAYANNDENHAYNGGESVSEDKPGSDLVDGFFESTQEPGTAETQASRKRMRMAAMAMPAAANDGIMLLDDTAAADDTTAVDGSVDETTNFKLIGRKDESTSNAGKTIIAMSKVNYSNAVYMDRLNKRMGEARYIDGDEGLWVRMRHDRIGKSDAFRSKNTMFELGYDRKVGDREDGEHRQGVVFDYMRGTADYHNVAGEGDVRRGGVWFYDTWLGNKGHYTDYVLKFGRLSNDFDIYSELGEKITGDYSNFVYSASAEYGRKKSLGGDWYIEPQAQLQYAHVTDADYTTSQGTSVQLDAIDSLIGRVGFRLGKDVSDTSTFYIKADVLHEFLGDQDISAFDETGRLDTTYENEGTWYDVGLGFSHQFSKGTYMFLDVEKTFGNDNEDTYQFNVGMNWKV
ncbi:autotransporter outer membrane beta-barrel domain-containing protein [Megasphaera stantonii]|uniref:autotransporter outer membrane beta-barrel domain-containing protein n=1 Tax=Megasphaera stantonii TaxID=2144175 RepID=UPI00320B3A91